MNNIFFLFLRRMRQPLLTLIAVYAIAILGLVLIPGQDADGNPWRMDFFHAFYFVSFMSTTIGFGEIPYAFTEAQRMWATFCVYATVIGWLYAIGKLLTLVQDRNFQQAIVERSFSRRVKHIREAFYLVCGYGETGSALIQALTSRHRRAVAIDIDDSRVNLLHLENLREYVPALHGDARRPFHLLEAGLKNPHCSGVVALTNHNEANLKIAITAKLLHPNITVICRADSHDIEANMASFGTDHIIDPFDTFAYHLAIALGKPGLYLLQEWLNGEGREQLSEPVYPPKDGHWIICGYGRFGKAVYGRLSREGINTVIVEATPERTGEPAQGVIKGRGTEANTLQEAGVDNAVGLVAGTDNDANNLSIIMTAQEMNPTLFSIARQNLRDNLDLFMAVGADMIMHPSTIIADKIRILLATPLLYEFLELAHEQDDDWACEMVSRIAGLVKAHVPMVIERRINEQESFAVTEALNKGLAVTLGHILTDPWREGRKVSCIPLLIKHAEGNVFMPGMDEPIQPDDRILLCGRADAISRMGWVLFYPHTLHYILTGEYKRESWVWRKIARLNNH